MASIVAHGNRWRAHLHVNGVRKSKVFRTKGEARAWIKETETALVSEDRTVPTLHQVFEDYIELVSPHHNGHRWEKMRIKNFQAYFGETIKVTEIRTPDIVRWRDKRLKAVKSATVRREMTLLSSIFQQAWKEWQLITENPCADAKKPKDSVHRTVLITDKERDAIVKSMGYAGGVPENKTQRTAMIFLFALETAMRCGEICAIEPSDIDPHADNVLHTKLTKNGTQREVPLSPRAKELLELAGGAFGVSSGVVDQYFRRHRDQCGLTHLNFHDTRHTAITRWAEKVNMLELQRISGHLDMKFLKVYYNKPTRAIADKLSEMPD